MTEYAYDTNGDGCTDVLNVDEDFNGVTDYSVYDSNFDGIWDRIEEDRNDNGVLERISWDTNFDGVMDQEITDPAEFMGTGVWFPPTEMPMGYPSAGTGNPVVDAIVTDHNNAMVDIWLQPGDRDYDGLDTDGDQRDY